MRRPGIIITLLSLVIIWLVVVIYLAGTVPGSNPQSGQQNINRVNGGLVPLPGADKIRPVAFEEAMDQLPSFLVETKGVFSNLTIHYIRGKDPDDGGLASTWLFGVRFDNQSALMYYDASGWQSIPWQGGLPEQEIVNGSFVPPGELIRSNAGIIFGPNPMQKDHIQLIELGNGIYTVRVSVQEKQQILLFDAGSGALIPSYA